MNEAGIPSPDPRLSPARTKWFALGALAVATAAFLFIAIGGIGENLVYYWGPKELRAAGAKANGATIRLGGQVAVGSVKRGDGVSNLEFDVTDGTATVHVVSHGAPPVKKTIDPSLKPGEKVVDDPGSPALTTISRSSKVKRSAPETIQVYCSLT